jgi:hypothetical protein
MSTRIVMKKRYVPEHLVVEYIGARMLDQPWVGRTLHLTSGYDVRVVSADEDEWVVELVGS